MLALFAGAQARAANGVIASDGFGRMVSGGWGIADVGGAWTVLDRAASWSNEDTAKTHTFALHSYRATTLAPPPSTIASDRFQRTVASGWGNADTGGWWTVVGSPWNWSTGGGAGKVTVGAASDERAYLSSFTVQNVDIVEKVVLPKRNTNKCGAFVLGRYSPAYSPTYYRVGVVQGAGGNIFLRGQRSDGSNLARGLDTGIPAAAGAQVMLRVEFHGAKPTVIRARAWRAGTAEPKKWLLNTTDNTSAEQKAGMLGVRLQNEDRSSAPYLSRLRACKRLDRAR